MHILLNFVYLIYVWNGHYNTSFSFNYYKYVLSNYGLGLKLGHIN
jgi:hypothetical protein